MKRFFLFFVFIVGTLSADLSLPSKYISVWGVWQSCDVRNRDDFPEARPQNYIQPENVKPGDVIWVRSFYLPEFYREVLPRIHAPFVLVINHGDESFPTSFKNAFDTEDLIANKNILHIFSQNCDYMGPQKEKVSPLPIGIDIHTLAVKSGFNESIHTPHEQEAILDQVVNQSPPTHKRIMKALVDFHLVDTIVYPGNTNVNRYLAPGETRGTIAAKIANSGVVDFVHDRVRRRDLWQMKGKYAFSICPPGNGLDTHRAWEDLILGCIVIVHSSPMDPLFEGLPVVIIHDWSEINRKNFEKWMRMYGDASSNPGYRERITLKYWMNKIKKG